MKVYLNYAYHILKKHNVINNIDKRTHNVHNVGW